MLTGTPTLSDVRASGEIFICRRPHSRCLRCSKEPDQVVSRATKLQEEFKVLPCLFNFIAKDTMP